MISRKTGGATKSPRPVPDSLLLDAGMTVKSRNPILGGHIYELAAADAPGLRVALFDSASRGLTLGIRLDLPPDSELTRLAPDSERVLLFLGALTAGLQSQGLEAHLVSGQQGLEGVMVSAHVCRAGMDQALLRDRLHTLRRTADALVPVLTEPGASLITRARAAVQLRNAAYVSPTRPIKAIVVPTFNEEERDRMMREAAARPKARR